MRRNASFGKLPVAALAAITLVGLAASGHAQQAEVVAVSAVALAQPQGPVFVPGADPRFVDAFAEFDTITTPVEPMETARAIPGGMASYYADRFNGQRTASGERFSNSELTAAHRTLPFGSRVRVTNPRSGASVVVRINDRGPFTRGRTIDLSRAAADQVGIVRAGHGEVVLELLEG